MPLTTKRCVGLRERGERLVDLIAVEVDIVEIGVLRRLDQREDDPLVLLGGASSELVWTNRKAVIASTASANSAVTGR